MRILVVHNHYQQAGGEESAFTAERQLLEQAGHNVVVYERRNTDIRCLSPLEHLVLARDTIWARDTYIDISEIAKKFRPAVAHFHNTFPLISPAGWTACRDQGVPVVQTLHNYRLICPNGLLYRDGDVCESCVTRRVPWPGIVHACYRDSRAQTAVVSTMLTVHRMRRSYERAVSLFLALTNFAKAAFVRGGLPKRAIRVKPPFLDFDPGFRRNLGDYAIFVGRLSREKGIDVMLRAWRSLPGVPLKIVGDGPLFDQIVQTIRAFNLQNVELLGRQPRSVVTGLLKGSRLLVLPSTCYEGFPITVLEALACGIPVIASRTGGLPEIIDDGTTGILVGRGDQDELSAAVKALWRDSKKNYRMGDAARTEFERKYRADVNYSQLMDIYTNVTRPEESPTS